MTILLFHPVINIYCFNFTGIRFAIRAHATSKGCAGDPGGHRKQLRSRPRRRKRRDAQGQQYQWLETRKSPKIFENNQNIPFLTHFLQQEASLVCYYMKYLSLNNEEKSWNHNLQQSFFQKLMNFKGKWEEFTTITHVCETKINRRIRNLTKKQKWNVFFLLRNGVDGLKNLKKKRKIIIIIIMKKNIVCSAHQKKHLHPLL